jgi:very-short-patch-repair endonuclease
MTNLLTQTARKLRHEMTDAERRLWSRLRGHHTGIHFRRQAPLERYVLDFVCFQARLVIEVDGGQHAESEADKLRDAWLKEKGFRVLRFWNNEVLENIEGVLETIMKALEDAPTPPPQPSPMKGEGGKRMPSPIKGEGVDGEAANHEL